MANALTLTVIREPDYLPADRIQIELDGAVQSDRIPAWDHSRARKGFGYGNARETSFGVWMPPPADTLFGAGLFGQGAGPLIHTTINSYVAGDYQLRARSVDALGNASNWSPAETIEHRPIPPAPTSLAIAAGVLSWTWSDP